MGLYCKLQCIVLSVSYHHCYQCRPSCYRYYIDTKVSLLVKLSSEKLCISGNSLGNFKDN